MDGTGLPDQASSILDEQEATSPPGAGDDRWREVPPALRPTSNMPKWPFFLAGFLLLVGLGLFVAVRVTVPYYALSPGPVNQVENFVSVPEPVGSSVGELFFLTVSLEELSALEYVGAWLDDRVELAPRENIRPTGVSREDLRRQNFDLMETSKHNAIFVALTQLEYDVTFEGSGALVSAMIPGSAADGQLLVGDVLVSVDGAPVEFSTDAVNLIGGRPPGEQVLLSIRRPTDESATEFTDVDIPLVLGHFMAEDPDGNPVEDLDRGMVGVLLMNAEVNIVFPVDVEIDSENIGGPSAGLMFALQIIDLLTEDDLTSGNRIAGTGTIDQDGIVGAIGGIQQKVYGAIDAGAGYVLVPAANYDDAIAAAGDDIVIVRVEHIDDALTFLDTL